MENLLLFNPKFFSYGQEHFLWLLGGACSTIFWIWLGRRQAHEHGQRRIGLIMSLIPATLWACLSVYMILNANPVDLGLVLPFHVCYFINLLIPVLMWKRSYFLFEIFYFMVMAGCVQALITPDVQYAFPHFMNVRYFTIHICLAQSMLYAIFVFDFRPSWNSLKKSFLWSNIYFAFIIVVNAILDTNFMYLRRKPNAATLLDLFGDWPWYIIGAEFLALALFTLVMLPFALPQWLAARSAKSEQTFQQS